MACRQHVSRSIGQEGREQRGSGFRQTGAQGILQVVDNQVRVFGSRAPMAEIGGWRTVSSVQRLSAGTFRAPVWRNCRHCRRRRSRRRQALPLMSRSLRSFDFRLLNRNAPDVPCLSGHIFVLFCSRTADEKNFVILSDYHYLCLVPRDITY